MGSKSEYEDAKRERDFDKAAERAMAELAIKLPALLERLVVALEKIADGNAIRVVDRLE